MINVPSEVITEYLTDSTHKGIEVDYNTEIRDVNRYYGMSEPDMFRTYYNTSSYNHGFFSVYARPSDNDFTNYVRITPGKWRYIIISFEFYVYTDAEYSLPGHWEVSYKNTNGTTGTYIFGNGVLSTNRTVFPYLWFVRPNNLASITYIRYVIDGGITLPFLYLFNGSISIKQSSNTINKPFKLAPDFNTIPIDGSAWWIRNDGLLYEDFALTESLCSKDNIKFGLCESAHCEFGYVGSNVIEVGNDITVNSTCDLSASQDIPDYAISRINWAMWNPTSQTSRSHTESLYHVIPLYQYTTGYYNWTYGFNGAFDLSPYYDKFFDNRYIGTAIETQITINSYTASERPTYIRLYFYYLGMDGLRYRHVTDYLLLADFENNYERVVDYTPATPRHIRGFIGVGIGFMKSDKSLYDESEEITATFNVKKIQYHSLLQDEIIPDYDETAYYLYREVHNLAGNLTDYLIPWSGSSSIPLGHFKVDSVTKKYRHNIVEQRVTAYDNLLTLEQNAADWYTQYMFGVDTDNWVSNGFEFARQIFATYWDYVTSVGLDSRDNYLETELAYYEYWADIKPSHLSNKYLTWQVNSTYLRLQYASFDVNNPDPSVMYMVSVNNATLGTGVRISDDYIIENYLGQPYKDNVDSLARGVCANGGVMVWENRSDGTSSGICVNRDGYFMISPECTSFTVYVPVYTVDNSYNVVNRIIDDVTIYSVETKPDLQNGNLRLCYYNYGTKEIFACDSSITGRDVVRSLLEVCGCFFRLDRYRGLPEFVYPTKGGLYPSNTLYPADDLYPRAGTDQLYSMGKYISVIAENYEVKDYGRIQILKKIKSSDTQSVVEWQYEGDPDSENTYIIDDNIFYCAEEMEYDYDGMPEVADMLEGMWGRISNLGYVPNTTEALGAPWLECGDRVGLLTYDGGFETFVFRRTLKGIQNLRDTYESEGDELNTAISNFGYSV